MSDKLPYPQMLNHLEKVSAKKVMCDPQTLLTALVEIYRLSSMVNYGSRSSAPYTIGMIRATARIAIEQSIEEDFPYVEIDPPVFLDPEGMK